MQLPREFLWISFSKIFRNQVKKKKFPYKEIEKSAYENGNFSFFFFLATFTG